MNIVTHTAQRLAIGSDAVVIAYSAIWLDCTHSCRGTNPYIGLIPDHADPLRTQGSSLVPRPFHKTENRPARKGLGKW